MERGKRTVVALAGPPASGKSTLADHLVAALNAKDPGRAAVVPMDGFHLDNAVLQARGRLAHKGAADTFDVGGFAALLDRLRANQEPDIAVPVFDRALEISRAAARMIPSSVDIVVTEGNYLLVSEPPWLDLRARFDLTALVRVGEAELRRRLQARWANYGVPDDEAQRKIDENDLPNGIFVLQNSMAADLVIDGTHQLQL